MPQYKLLIVDDESPICDLLEATLNDQYKDRLDVTTTTLPAKAAKILEEEKIAILITDLNMPEMAGDILIRQALNLKKGTQVIVITGFETLNAAINCHLDGARWMIKKPFTPELVFSHINDCIKTLDHWHQIIEDTKTSRKNALKSS